MTEVLFEEKFNGVGVITLNRPKVLNSLNLNMVQMIHEKLVKWEENDDIKLIILRGKEARAFCAGGDIKSLYKAKEDSEVLRYAQDFFKEEYQLDEYLASYKKPIIAKLEGIVMGGGVGLAIHSDYRIVTENTRWAMPEMNLGFFPDVGAGYFLNQAPNQLGKYLALTGEIINGKEALYIKAADYLLTSENTEKLFNELEHIEFKDDVKKEIDLLIKKYETENIQSFNLFVHEDKINTHFAYDSVEEIIESLENDRSDFSNSTRHTLLGKSPVSLKVANRQLTYCKEKSLEEVLTMDYILAFNFLRHHDFYEGVRSVLVDKDRTPDYDYKLLSDVNNQLVESFFSIN